VLLERLTVSQLDKKFPKFYLGDQIQKNEWAGHVACMGERGVYRVLVGKPVGNKPLGRTRHRWEDNIKMHLQEVGWEA
jgi:hypothetical protein